MDIDSTIRTASAPGDTSVTDVRKWESIPQPFPEGEDYPNTVFELMTVPIEGHVLKIIPVFGEANEHPYEVLYLGGDEEIGPKMRSHQFYSSFPSSNEFQMKISGTFSSKYLLPTVLHIMQFLSFAGKTPEKLRFPMFMIDAAQRKWTVSIDVYVNPSYPRSYLMPHIFINPLQDVTDVSQITLDSRDAVNTFTAEMMAKQVRLPEEGRPP